MSGLFQSLNHRDGAQPPDNSASAALTLSSRITSRMRRCCSARRAASRASAARSSALLGPPKLTTYADLAQKGHGASSPPLRGDTTCGTDGHPASAKDRVWRSGLQEGTASHAPDIRPCCQLRATGATRLSHDKKR